jgi:hypothetical protein
MEESMVGQRVAKQKALEGYAGKACRGGNEGGYIRVGNQLQLSLGYCD